MNEAERTERLPYKSEIDYEDGTARLSGILSLSPLFAQTKTKDIKKTKFLRLYCLSLSLSSVSNSVFHITTILSVLT